MSRSRHHNLTRIERHARPQIAIWLARRNDCYLIAVGVLQDPNSHRHSTLCGLRSETAQDIVAGQSLRGPCLSSNRTVGSAVCGNRNTLKPGGVPPVDARRKLLAVQEGEKHLSDLIGHEPFIRSHWDISGAKRKYGSIRTNGTWFFMERTKALSIRGVISLNHACHATTRNLHIISSSISQRCIRGGTIALQ